jgi:hypothetical protein
MHEVLPGIDFPGFDREPVTAARLTPELLKSAEGQFVALVGDELVGPVGSPADAERAGYGRDVLGRWPLFFNGPEGRSPLAFPPPT